MKFRALPWRTQPLNLVTTRGRCGVLVGGSDSIRYFCHIPCGRTRWRVGLFSVEGWADGSPVTTSPTDVDVTSKRHSTQAVMERKFGEMISVTRRQCYSIRNWLSPKQEMAIDIDHPSRKYRENPIENRQLTGEKLTAGVTDSWKWRSESVVWMTMTINGGKYQKGGERMVSRKSTWQ